VTVADNFEVEHEEHQRQLKTSMTIETTTNCSFLRQVFTHNSNLSTISVLRVSVIYERDTSLSYIPSSSESSCVKSPALQGQPTTHFFAVTLVSIISLRQGKPYHVNQTSFHADCNIFFHETLLQLHTRSEKISRN
jgi:hypothetical protein